MSSPIENNTEDLLEILQMVNQLPSTNGFVKKKTFAVTVPASGWVNFSQSITVTGATEESDVIVSPASSSHDAYCDAGVRCSGQAADTLTFFCRDIPSENLTVNVMIIYEEGKT